MAKAGSPTAKCRLCFGPGPLTDEDITPMWMRRHLISKNTGPKPAQLPPRHKFRICRLCNEQLGVTFESSAAAVIKRLIDGHAVVITPAEQRVVGGWMSKTVLLTCLADSKPENWGHELARRTTLKMISSGCPPINTTVRLACMATDSTNGGIPDGYTGNLLPAKMSEFAFFGINIVGRLCFEVVTGLVDYQRYLRWIDGRTLRFVRIWPGRLEGVNWPPAKPLYQKQVDQMREAFMNARRPDVTLADPRRRVEKWGS